MKTNQTSDQYNWDKRFKRHDHIVSRAIIGETLLIPISGQLADMQHIFTMNSVAVSIWDQLDGKSSLGEIRDGMIDRFDVQSEEATSDLLDFIHELCDAKLIEEIN
jgi:hypothetical protein